MLKIEVRDYIYSIGFKKNNVIICKAKQRKQKSD